MHALQGLITPIKSVDFRQKHTHSDQSWGANDGGVSNAKCQAKNLLYEDQILAKANTGSKQRIKG